MDDGSTAISSPARSYARSRIGYTVRDATGPPSLIMMARTSAASCSAATSVSRGPSRWYSQYSYPNRSPSSSTATTTRNTRNDTIIRTKNDRSNRPSSRSVRSSALAPAAVASAPAASAPLAPVPVAAPSAPSPSPIVSLPSNTVRPVNGERRGNVSRVSNGRLRATGHGAGPRGGIT